MHLEGTWGCRQWESVRVAPAGAEAGAGLGAVAASGGRSAQRCSQRAQGGAAQTQVGAAVTQTARTGRPRASAGAGGGLGCAAARPQSCRVKAGGDGAAQGRRAAAHSEPPLSSIAFRLGLLLRSRPEVSVHVATVCRQKHAAHVQACAAPRPSAGSRPPALRVHAVAGRHRRQLGHCLWEARRQVAPLGGARQLEPLLGHALPRPVRRRLPHALRPLQSFLFLLGKGAGQRRGGGYGRGCC